MSKQTDPEFLKNEAYENAEDLEIRIDIQTRFSSNPVPWFRWLRERLALPGSGKVLDLGCGSGDLWLDHNDLFIDRLSFILSDLSLGMLLKAKEQLSPGEGIYSYSVLDAQSLPFPDAVFNCLIGSGLLDHLPNHLEGLSEIKRVLKPGGRFYTTAGSRSHLQEIQTLVEPFLDDVDYGGDPDRFGLENGRQILSTWFTQVELSS
jgi:SAM-dependent methyltransferase